METDRDMNEEDVVIEWAKLQKEKQDILKAKADIDSKLQRISSKVIELGMRTSKTQFSINPSDNTEVQELGEAGQVKIRVKNDFERLYRDVLTKLCIKFWKLLCPDDLHSDCDKMGTGQADWMWANREVVTSKYVERTYTNNTQNARKKPSRKRAKPNSDVSMNNIPKTQDEFHELSVLQHVQNQMSQK